MIRHGLAKFSVLVCLDKTFCSESESHIPPKKRKNGSPLWCIALSCWYLWNCFQWRNNNKNYLLLKLSWLPGWSDLCAGPSNPEKPSFSSVCLTHTHIYTHKHTQSGEGERTCVMLHVEIRQFRVKAVPFLLVRVFFFFTWHLRSAAIMHLHRLLLLPLPHTTAWHSRELESKLKTACLVSKWQSETVSTSEENQQFTWTHSFAFFFFK